ncbi:Ig-like domain repeat protein [Rhodococcus hoagii]|uniref:Ig-like domain-containing protein n=1 Tax=Rhodococcus hoagii TaxID=43767 RepID=UPI001965610F|nr:Ig-like domain-containing protein [Prescottella equi]MBM9838228.1 Ig-like domain repeat protein [Prescottella equi]
MFSSTLRRVVAPVLAVGAATALALGAGAGTAAAADPPPQSSRTVTSAQLVLKKEVIGSNVVHPGDTVTYKITASYTGSGPWPLNELSIPELRDIPPTGFTLVPGSAVATYLGATNRASITTNSYGGASATCTSGCTFAVGGFVIKNGQPVTLQASYKVPNTYDATNLGVHDSGVIVKPNTWQTDQGGANFGVFVRVDDNREVTTTSVSAPATVGKGIPANLTATVSPSTATGAVQFFEGTNPIGDPVEVSDGTATLAHAFAEMGNYAISAKYIPTGLFKESEASPTQVEVGPVVTTAAVTVPATAEAGSTVPLQATVTPADAEGTVQFALNGNNIGGPVQVSGGTAALNHRFDDPGNFAVTANFVGGFGFAASAAPAQQIAVSYGDWQTTTVVVEPVTAEAGSPTNLMATVRPIPTGGTVTFSVDGTAVGAVDLGTADGVAALAHTFDTAGTYQVVADFAGTEGFSASTSAPFTATVAPTAPVLTAVNADLTVQGLSVVGQTVTLTVDVDPADAQGTVQFYKGTEAVGAPVAVVDGKASVTTTLDFEGTQLITAKFVAGEGFRDTVSNPVVLNVSAAPVAPEPGAGSLGSLLEAPLAGLLAGSIGG